MDAAEPRISLAELNAAGVRLRPADAAAIVRELALQVARGELPGIPSIAVIRITAAGTVAVEGPVAADGEALSRAAQLLDSLLPSAAQNAQHAPTRGRLEFRAPGGLRLAVARALGTSELPPFATLRDFVDALTRFAPADSTGAMRRLYEEAAGLPHETSDTGLDDAASPRSLIRTEPVALEGEGLTVSDIRRARRATGLTLAEVAESSRIPAWLLRELEWGYLANWPAGLYGRTQLVRYARAAGLDESVIVRTLWPQLEEFARERGTVTVAPENVRPADPQSVEPGMMLIPVERGPIVPVKPPMVRRRRLLAALSIAALLLVATLPAIWDRMASKPEEPPPQPAAAERIAPDPPQTSPPPAAAEQRSVPDPLPSPPPVHARAARAAAVVPAFTDAGTAVFDPDDPGTAARSTLRITRVVDDGRSSHARLSPDGTQIAFDSDRNGEWAVFVAQADGRNVRRVSGAGMAAMPSWSPDGRALAVSRAEPERPDVWNLWMVNVATGESSRVTDQSSAQIFGASWFPDGRRLAFSVDDRLVIRDLEHAAERSYRFPLRGRRLGTPAVSPDGRRVIVPVADSGAWMLELADGSMRRVLDDPTAAEYAWAPDGRRVAYHSGRSGQWNIWVRASRPNVDP